MSTALQNCLLGILIGDAHGSPYEGRKVSGTRIGPYTDDTEQAYGIALWLLSRKMDLGNLGRMLRAVYTGADRGYGNSQIDFLEGREHRKDSYGNGAAMRAAPIGVCMKDPKSTIAIATLQCRLSHDHPEAIAGSVTVALLAHLIQNGKDLRRLALLYPGALLPQAGKRYVCSLETVESVPPAVDAFLRGKSFQDVLTRALAWGNDVDTIAAIACGLAALKFPIPPVLIDKTIRAHPDNAKMQRMILSLGKSP
jgi:ADP-ribosyl-[dinitrogen reductase] hydrolase